MISKPTMFLAAVAGAAAAASAQQVPPSGSNAYRINPGDVLEQVISRGLESQYRGAVPQVTVSVKNPSGLQFSVVGKVRNPGTFTPGRYINALEALSIAGGPTEFAQLGGVVIIRKEPTGLRSFRVRLNDVLKGSPSANDLSPAAIPDIQSGDTVVVP
jgi:polysaccharide export outer membrane protein